MTETTESSRTVTILAGQIDIPLTRNRKRMEDHVVEMVSSLDRRLGERSADMVVLPELSTIEYSRESFDQLDELAGSPDASCFNPISKLAIAHDAWIVFGMPRHDDGRFYISQVVVDPAGHFLGCYDKLHICQYGASMEKEYYQRGQNLCVFEVNGLKFAPIICYDIRIPELSRTLTLKHGVDCILHCGAYFRDESFATWHAFATTRALENQVYLLSLNRAGADYGNSVFCQPWMDDDHPATVIRPWARPRPEDHGPCRCGIEV